MKNRDRLRQMCEYDLLCMMQKNADERKHLQPFYCILSDITNANPLFRCAGYFHNSKHDCESCISEWLNEEFDGRW